MKVFVLIFTVILMPVLYAQNLDELESCRLTEQGLVIVSKPTGVKYICSLQDSEEYQRLNYGSKIIIPKNRSFSLFTRHLTLNFEVLSDGKSYGVTKTQDHRSSGGKLNTEVFVMFFKESGEPYFTAQGNSLESSNPENKGVIQLNNEKEKNRHERTLPDPDEFQKSKPQSKQTVEQESSSKADKPNSFPWWLLGVVGLIVVLGFMLGKGKSK